MILKNNFFNKNTILQQLPSIINAEIQDPAHTKMSRCMHKHDDRVEILYIRKGKGIHQIDGHSYATKAGDILIFDSNVLHDESADKSNGLDIISCSIGKVQLTGFAPNTLLSAGFCPVISNSIYSDKISSILSIIYQTHNDKSNFNQELLQHLACSLIILVYQASIQNEITISPRIFEIGSYIQKYIDEHYLEDIDIPHIAKSLKLGESYISHSFKKATGYSIMQYVIRRRVGEAQSWLLMSNLSVTDIAIKVGYNSVSNFHNTFRKIVGMSPKQYRTYWKAK